MIKVILVFTLFCSLSPFSIKAQGLYTFPAHTQTAWSSFENPKAEKGVGGQENEGAKGHPAEFLAPSQSKVLLEVEGAGTIQRIWMTLLDRSPGILRSLRLDMYWDGEKKPAVSVPLGDFFGIGLGRTAAFENTLFSSPEGRSFNCYIPMPFRKGAHIVITNESDKTVILFYDINFVRVRKQPASSLYFHAYWNRNTTTKLGEDFEILPQVTGKGRFLGCNLGMITDPIYRKSWWGEGEVKMYIDSDSSMPSLVGTGTEDYIGTGFTQGAFSHLYQGCPIADTLKGQWAFYRYHVPDPVYFTTQFRVSIQQMGADMRDNVIKLAQAGARLQPVAVVSQSTYIKLLELDTAPLLTDTAFPDGLTLFYRLDNYSSTAYFYLDKPVNTLPPLATLQERREGL